MSVRCFLLLPLIQSTYGPFGTISASTNQINLFLEESVDKSNIYCQSIGWWDLPYLLHWADTQGEAEVRDRENGVMVTACWAKGAWSLDDESALYFIWCNSQPCFPFVAPNFWASSSLQWCHCKQTVFFLMPLWGMHFGFGTFSHFSRLSGILRQDLHSFLFSDAYSLERPRLGSLLFSWVWHLKGQNQFQRKMWIRNSGAVYY